MNQRIDERDEYLHDLEGCENLSIKNIDVIAQYGADCIEKITLSNGAIIGFYANYDYCSFIRWDDKYNDLGDIMQRAHSTEDVDEPLQEYTALLDSMREVRRIEDIPKPPKPTWTINYNNGFKVAYNGTLAGAKRAASAQAGYTSHNITIEDADGNLIALRRWVPWTAGINSQRNPIQIGNYGYYADWVTS